MRIENPMVRVISDKESKMMIEQKRKMERERETEMKRTMNDINCQCGSSR